MVDVLVRGQHRRLSEASLLVERGERALSDHEADPASVWDPLLPTVMRYLDEARGGQRDRASVIRRWEGNAQVRGYRWAMDWYDDPANPARWARRPGQDRVVWRPLEANAGRAFAEPARLVRPLVLVEAMDFLEETAASHPELEAEALALRDEAASRVAFDFAAHVVADDVWKDSWALWLLARREHALAGLEHIAMAIATRFAQRARYEGWSVRGTRYPYFEVPMVSASAHVASALWTLGLYPELIPPLLSFVRDQQRDDGGWGDEGQPSDLLTTLAAADLLAHLEPGFTLEPVSAERVDTPGRAAARNAVRFFAARQEPAGWWRALDPETPWLTVQVCRWLRAIEQPFPIRFGWPQLARWQRDRKTAVPLFAFFEDLSNAAGLLGGLGSAPVEVAFFDLIGFGDWNNRFGESLGDELLRVFADGLRAIPNSLPVRDGGDEFLVIGKPGLVGVLEGSVDAFLAAWLDRCRAAFPGADPVFARAILSGGVMRDALAIRNRLGDGVGQVKTTLGPEAPWGVMAVIDGEVPRAVRGLPRRSSSQRLTRSKARPFQPRPGS